MKKFGTLVLFFFLLSVSLSFAQDTVTNAVNKSDTAVSNIAYVVFDGDTLFSLSEYQGAFSPQERVDAIVHRLEEIVDNNINIVDSLRVEDVNNASLIFYEDAVIMSVTDLDAVKAEVPRVQLANNYKKIIKTYFADNVEIDSLKSWGVRIGLTLLTLAGLFVIFFAVNRLFKWINTKVDYFESKLKRKRKNILRYLIPKGSHSAMLTVSNVLRYIVLIIISILYLPLLFRFLPWTKGIVQQFYSFITDPINAMLKGLLDFLPDLFIIIIIVYITKYIIRVLSYLEQEYEKDNITLKGFHKDWAKPTLNIIKIIIYAFALIFMFPYLPGSSSPAFKGVSLFLGLLLSLGSTSAISNIVAGIVITYMRPFMIGDRVRVGETIGDVIEKSLLVTKIRTIKNEDVTIPNATIINTHLWNYTKNAKELGVILHTSVTIGYDVPWDKVNKLLMKAARNTKLTQRTPAPFVLQKSLDDNYVSYEINVYTKQAAKMQAIYSDLHRNILEAFNNAKIEILSPMYIAARDGNPSTIPSESVAAVNNPVEEIIDTLTGKNQKTIKK